MNNLHRDPAPVSEAARDDLEEEAGAPSSAPEAAGAGFAGVDTGHLDPSRRRTQPAVEPRVPFTVDRGEVDIVERGARDADRRLRAAVLPGDPHLPGAHGGVGGRAHGRVRGDVDARR
ncbi:hypothetical protein [Actinacidiphila sp. bgisy160]|uniref:hypothetical protein n=1 Tax=Actinacidiphila sp. bgisy160 TaxID=3413796 RepID=UPI003D75DD1A